jgi:hypothetical protein
MDAELQIVVQEIAVRGFEIRLDVGVIRIDRRLKQNSDPQGACRSLVERPVDLELARPFENATLLLPGDTPRLLRTRSTVASDTPAAAAKSLAVGLPIDPVRFEEISSRMTFCLISSEL